MIIFDSLQLMMDTPPMITNAQFNITRDFISRYVTLQRQSVLSVISLEDPKERKRLSDKKRIPIRIIDKVIIENGYKNSTQPAKNFSTDSTVSIIKVFFCSKLAMFNDFIPFIKLSNMTLTPNKIIRSRVNWSLYIKNANPIFRI